MISGRQEPLVPETRSALPELGQGFRKIRRWIHNLLGVLFPTVQGDNRAPEAMTRFKFRRPLHFSSDL